MRHCVVCHADYVENPPRCPDCGHRTLDADERAVWDGIREELTQEDMVPVHVFDGPVDRAIVGELLDDSDVPHMVRGNALGGATLTAQSGGWGIPPGTDEEWGLRSRIRSARRAPVRGRPPR